MDYMLPPSPAESGVSPAGSTKYLLKYRRSLGGSCSGDEDYLQRLHLVKEELAAYCESDISHTPLEQVEIDLAVIVETDDPGVYDTTPLCRWHGQGGVYRLSLERRMHGLGMDLSDVLEMLDDFGREVQALSPTAWLSGRPVELKVALTLVSGDASRASELGFKATRTKGKQGEGESVSKRKQGQGDSVSKRTTAWPVLEQRLLSLGGRQVEHDPDLDQVCLVLTEGGPFHEKVRLRRGWRHQCHKNAAEIWGQDPGRYTLCTGYGLGYGRWVRHSWLLDGDHIIETTYKMARCFGRRLKPGEANRFWVHEFFTERYPGPAAFLVPWLEHLDFLPPGTFEEAREGLAHFKNARSA